MAQNRTADPVKTAREDRERRTSGPVGTKNPMAGDRGTGRGHLPAFPAASRSVQSLTMSLTHKRTTLTATVHRVAPTHTAVSVLPTGNHLIFLKTLRGS